MRNIMMASRSNEHNEGYKLYAFFVESKKEI